MSSGMALADSAMQGIAAVPGSARSRRSTSKPSKSGSCRSISTRSGRSAFARAHAGAAGRLRRDRQAGDGLHQLLDQQHVDLVVLDVEDLPGALAARLAPRRQRRVGGLGALGRAEAVGRGGQRHLEQRAFARLAAHRDAAAHAFDQRLDDGQADAGAFDAFALGAEAVERLEQAAPAASASGRARCRAPAGPPCRLPGPRAPRPGRRAGCT